jgi:hypothetical protein
LPYCIPLSCDSEPVHDYILSQGREFCNNRAGDISGGGFKRRVSSAETFAKKQDAVRNKKSAQSLVLFSYESF